MNKQMIILIALAVVMFVMPASAEETVEVRGTVVELTDAQTYDIAWDAHNFGAFWYDLDDDLSTECLVLKAGTVSDWDRTIDEACLSYTTCPLYQEYELYACEGLTVDGSEGYYLEGWMGLPYVAIDGNADKFCELLVEFWGDDRKTLTTGEDWDLGGGFALTAENLTCQCGTIGQCDSFTLTLSLSKNGVKLDEQTIYVNASDDEQDRVYAYTPNIGGEEYVPVFSCYVDAGFHGTDSDLVQLMYVFLIDDGVMKINTSETYGAMEVTTASSSQVILKNEYDIDLDPDTTEHIMGDMYFETADDDYVLRFYPFVEHTIGGEEPAPPADTIPAIDTDNDGVPDAWDADNSTPAGYRTDPDGRGRMWGDMNGDGELTSADALMILQAAVGKINL